MLPTKTLELPFESGLDQKAHALWLEPGKSEVAQNLVKIKKGSLRKRQGLQVITRGYGSCSALNRVGTISNGRRITSFRGSPVMFGQGDTNLAQQQAVFTLQDGNGLNEWVATDIVPSSFLAPYEVVGPNSPISGEMDIGIANGLELFVYVVRQQIVCIVGRDAALGTIWLQPTLLYNAGSLVGGPRITVCGQYFVVSWSSATATNNIYAATLDSLNPANPIVNTATIINSGSGDSVNNINAATPNPYDVTVSLSDTANFTMIYERTSGGVAGIRVRVIAAATLVAVRTGNVNGADAQWTTDNGVSKANAQLVGLALRADATLNEIAFSYGWRTSSTTRVSAGLYTYTTLTNKESTINLLSGGTVGAITPSADRAPSVVTLELVGTAAGLSTYQTRWSPSFGAFNQGTTQLPYIASWQWSDSGAAIVPNTTQFPSITLGATLWSRDLLLNGIAYCVGYCPSSTQGTFYLFADDAWANNAEVVSGTTDYYPLRLEGIIAPRLSSGLTQPGSIVQPTTQAHFIANPYVSGSTYEVPFAIADSANTMTIGLQRVDFASPLDKCSGELGQNRIVAGSLSAAYDGHNFFELGFPYYPVITAITLAGTVGGLSAGIYQYIAQYRWIDNRGQIHLSARSAPFSVTASATQTATVRIATMGFSGRNKAACVQGLGNSPQSVWSRSNVNLQVIEILLYRTQVNGTSFNNVLPLGQIFVGSSTLQISEAAADGASDADIIGNDLLNGDGSDGSQPGDILDDLCGPASQAVVVHQSRIFLIDGPRVWPSKQFTTFAGSGFNEATAFSIDDGPGNLVGGASMDDKLILFKQDRLFYMTGLGPDDAGQNSDFIQPQRIASDVGCIDWRSIVTTPDGVYFQSAAGRRLLTRNLEVQPVTVVEDLDTTNDVTTGAVIHPTAGRCIFTQNTDDATSPRVGVVVDHDYLLDHWSDAIINDNAGHATIGFVSAAVANAVSSAGPPTAVYQTLYVLRDNGLVMREIPTTNFDKITGGANPSFVPLTWTSPWLKADGLQGWSMWAQVYIGFTLSDPCSLTITFAYGGNPTPVDTFIYSAAQLAAQTTGIGMLNLQPTRPQEPMIQISITDASDGSPVTGAGVVLAGVRVDYFVEPRVGYRAPIAQQG